MKVYSYKKPFSENGAPMQFRASIDTERGSCGSTLFAIAMQVVNLDPVPYTIEQDGKEIQKQDFISYSREVRSISNLKDAKEFIHENVERFINNYWSEAKTGFALD